LWHAPAARYLSAVTRPLRHWLPALSWAAVLFALSSIPGAALPTVPGWHVDKLVHGVLYLVLGFLCARALAATTRLKGATLVAAATLLGTAYGVTDELHQLLTPRRSCDWRDVIADGAGALIGAGVAVALSRHSNHSDHRGKVTPAV
jgi:VanZ family protein